MSVKSVTAFSRLTVFRKQQFKDKYEYVFKNAADQEICCVFIVTEHFCS
jgi:hypothetical protein